MSFQLPTLFDLVDRARKAFRTYLRGTDAYLWPNNINPTAKAIGGSVFEVFGFASYISKMIFVHTAPDLDTLKLHAAEFGMALIPAQPATGTIRVTTSTDWATGVGGIFQRLDGVQYVTGSALSIVGAGTVDVPVTAITDGAVGNALDGTAVQIVSGATGDPTATAAAVGDIVAGADVEDIESFRARILFRKRNPPQAGAAADYVRWASEVAGVTRVFVERNWAGSGTVRVFVLMDNLYPNGIPTPDAIARVADHIETVRPAGALVTVAAPLAVPVNITVSGLVPMTTTVEEAVRASLREAFFRLSAVAGSDTARPSMPYLATAQSFSLSWIWQAVANATGEQRHKITAPTVDVALASGQIATLGTVAFV